MRIAVAVAIATLCVAIIGVGIMPQAARADPADWTQITPPEGFRWGTFTSVDMVNGGFGVVAGSQGLIEYHSGVFVPVTPTLYLHRSLGAVDTISETDGWAVGGAGILLHYDDQVWHVVPSPTEQWLMAVAMISASDGWAIGATGDVIHEECRWMPHSLLWGGKRPARRADMMRLCRLEQVRMRSTT